MNASPEPARQRKGEVQAFCFLAAALCGFATFYLYNPSLTDKPQPALLPVALAIVFGWLGMLPPRALLHSRLGLVHVRLLLLAGCLAGLLALPWQSRVVARLLGAHPPSWMLAGFVLAVVSAALGAFLLPRRNWLRLVMAAHVVLFLWRGIVMLALDPNRVLDVVLFHEIASERLAQGRNPYSPPYPNMALPDIGPLIYPPEYVDGTVLHIGYVYPPASLLTGWPAYLITGDYRIAFLLALVLIALMCYSFCPGFFGLTGGALLLLLPPTFLMVANGWTETFSVLALCVLMFCWSRWPRANPYVFGWLIGLKQTMVLAAPFVLTLLPGWSPKKNFAVRAVALAAAVVVPFLVWNPTDLWRMIVLFHLKSNFRPDAISISTFLIPNTEAGRRVAMLIAVGLYAFTTWVLLRRRAVTNLGECCAAIALSQTMFLVANRQAFLNYYYFASCAWLLAAALTLGLRFSGQTHGSSPAPPASRLGDANI